MKRTSIKFACLFCLIAPLMAKSTIKIDIAFCNNRINPVGVDPSWLFFSWQMQSDRNDVTQSAYQLVISSTMKKLHANDFDIYNTEAVTSNQSIQVPYKGPQLQSARTYYWQVRVRDNDGRLSNWSAAQAFTTGLAAPQDWNQAKWIGYEELPDSMRVVPFVHHKTTKDDPKLVKNAVSPLLRKEFETSKNVKQALLFISGLGHYEATINGQPIENTFLTPGWSHYDKTVLYNSYDVTDKIQRGKNVIGVMLGSGFFHVSQERYSKGTGTYGKPKLIAVLKITYNDGRTYDLVSDESWKTSPSPITFNNIYGGEDYDARLEQTGWNTVRFDDSQWKHAIVVGAPKGQLRAEYDYPVRFMETFQVKQMEEIEKNTYVYDFGQNVSGVPQIVVTGSAGQVVRITPVEELDETGQIKPMADATPHFYTYTLKGGGKEKWSPRFTYFAVRYVQVELLTGDADTSSTPPVVEDIQLLHNRNSAPSTGFFTTSNELFNRIYALVDWAVKSNLQSYITDNPQREKLSWQGEQNFMRLAINYNYDIYNLYRTHIQHIIDAQHESGLIPDIAPEYVQFEGPFVDTPEWGSTGILDLWFLYRYYGDTLSMRKAYPMMVRYARHLRSRATDHLLEYGLGDWLDIGNVTPKGLTATAYYFHAIDKLSKIAQILGKNDDARYYSELAAKIRLAFNQKFFNNATKTYGSGSQTSMAMPVALGIVEEEHRMDVLHNLVEIIATEDDYQITAGDVGHRFLVEVLYQNGYDDVLYKMTNRDDKRGYAFQLMKGNTALAETWDGGASQNQLAMGHILEWFHGGLLGIRQEDHSIAFNHIRIQPQPVGDITWAKGGFHSPYGWITSEWSLQADEFQTEVQIPVNTRATLSLPAAGAIEIFVNGIRLDDYLIEADRVIFDVGSGRYTISIK